MVESDTISAQEQDQRPTPFAVGRTTNHIGSTIGQVACTLFCTGIRNIRYLWFAPGFTSVMTDGSKFMERAFLVSKQHDDGSIWLKILAWFYLTGLFASIF